MSLFKQRSNLFIRESSNAATDTGHKKRQVLMLLSERDKLVHIRTNRLNAPLHRRDPIALALQTYALPHDSSKLTVGDISRTTAVHSRQIASEHKNLVRLQLRNTFWCRSHMIHRLISFCCKITK